MFKEKDVFDFGRYYRYNELVEILRNLVEKYPKLARLRSIGKSYEGRDLWVMEVTNYDKGAADDKPAIWIDGNIHAGEVTGSIVCLKTIWYLLTKYGNDAFVTDLMDTRAFYVEPRVNPDGAEYYLTTPYTCRSSVRPYPYTEKEWEEFEGLYREDVDGDGYVTQMRVIDPNGDWKISDKDPRLMIKRGLDESGGVYYRIYPEGLILNYNKGEVKFKPPKFGLDMNRNYPGGWLPEGVQSGAGPYPLSEPETKAQADFILAHKNIWATFCYHTSGRFLCCVPAERQPGVELEWSEKDIAPWKAIGAMGKEVTGYYPRPGVWYHGLASRWHYTHLGVYSWTPELWNLLEHLGFGNFKELEERGLRLDTLKEEEGLRVLEWNDRELAGNGFVNWTAYNHPQLGQVEIGGWKEKFIMQNPPEKLLEAEVDKSMMFPLKHAALSPLIKITQAEAKPISEQIFRIKVTVQNTGFIPTNVTQKAVELRIAKPVVTELRCGKDVELISGPRRVEVGHLEGRSDRLVSTRIAVQVEDRSKKIVEWLIKLTRLPSKVDLVVISEKGGRDQTQIKLIE